MGCRVKKRIGEIGAVAGGATPSTKRPDYWDGAIPWVSPKDLANYDCRYISHGVRNITQEGYESCSTRLLPKGSVLFSSRAPIGYVAIAANPICTNQGFKSVIPHEGVDPLFLYYLLKANREAIEGLGSGTTFKEISASAMRDVEVLVPSDYSEQRAIAQVLGSIDDKIELNNRINGYLANLAAA